ncbi:MAG: hypothetical protein ABSA39_10015 [Edaphobacter sp.]
MNPDDLAPQNHALERSGMDAEHGSGLLLSSSGSTPNLPGIGKLRSDVGGFFWSYMADLQLLL